MSSSIFVMSILAAFALMAPSGPASAEGVPFDPERSASWDTSGTPTLTIRGHAGEPVEIRYAVALGNLAHHWTESDLQLDDAGALDLEIQLPEDAWLHDLAEDYVTDLTTFVDIGPERHVLPHHYLAWPAGRATTPEVLTRREMRSSYPNGVLDPALRQHASGPEVRVMPVTGGTTQLDDTGVQP